MLTNNKNESALFAENEDFYNELNNCANFVSYALKAGGLNDPK